MAFLIERVLVAGLGLLLLPASLSCWVMGFSMARDSTDWFDRMMGVVLLLLAVLVLLGALYLFLIAWGRA